MSCAGIDGNVAVIVEPDTAAGRHDDRRIVLLNQRRTRARVPAKLASRKNRGLHKPLLCAEIDRALGVGLSLTLSGPRFSMLHLSRDAQYQPGRHELEGLGVA